MRATTKLQKKPVLRPGMPARPRPSDAPYAHSFATDAAGTLIQIREILICELGHGDDSHTIKLIDAALAKHAREAAACDTIDRPLARRAE